MFETREEAQACGMAVAYHARQRPDKLALATAFGDRTFRELNARANQLSRLLARHGIGAGAAAAAQRQDSAAAGAQPVPGRPR